MSASPLPEMNLDEALRLARAEGHISLGGYAAEHRALYGAPGTVWRRLRSRDELKAFHEAGHAVVALCFDRYVFGLSINPDSAVKIGNSGTLGGFALIGRNPEPCSSDTPDRLRSDRQSVALFASLTEAQPNWRSTLRTVQAWRAEVRALIDEHWLLVASLAGALLEKRTLNQSDIAAIVGRKKIAVP